MTAQETIQAIVDQYQSLGWHFVRPVEIKGYKHPIIALWPDNEGTFTAHLNLSGDEPKISSISLFHKKSLGSLWFTGHHLTPAEVQAIIRLVKGEENVTYWVKEELEETGALAEYNHRYQK